MPSTPAPSVPLAQEYVLVSDNDGHHYVVPADKQREADDYFAAVSRYWEPGSDHDGEPPAEPEWLVAVGGAPSRVRFTGFRIE